MSEDGADMDIDNQSEDGEIKKSPSKDMDDFRYRKLKMIKWGYVACLIDLHAWIYHMNITFYIHFILLNMLLEHFIYKYKYK